MVADILVGNPKIRAQLIRDLKKVSVDESGRLVWIKPAGEPLAVTLQSRDSRPRNKSDLWFLDPGTPVWDAVTADGQELGIVVPQARERSIVELLPVVERTTV
jgi:hypothetical protein